MKTFSSLLLLTLVFHADLSAQWMSDSVKVDGKVRSFHFERPADGIKGKSLLFILHGSGGNGEGARRSTEKLQAMAAGEKLFIVYPDGYEHYWNECRRASNATANIQDLDEQQFFRLMIEYCRRHFNIDDRRVFAAGFSGGGHMAYKLALTMPSTFRAVAAVVANLPDEGWSDCTPAGKAVPVLIINGTADSTNPYNGGEMFVNKASFGKVMSTDRSFHYWSLLAGYSGDPLKKGLPDIDTSDHSTIESYRYVSDSKPEVELLKVIGGGHSYPKDIDVYLYAWEFFKRQLNRKPG